MSTHASVFSATLLAAAVFAPPGTAQVGAGEVGFLLTSNNTNFGTICTRTFSCTYVAADLFRGQSAELTVRGVQHQPFAIAVWIDQPHQCLALTGFHNSLMSSAFVLPIAGVLAQPDRILACPGGVETVRLPVPATVSLGSVLTLQALAFSYLNGGQVPTFSMALRATVR